MEVGIPWRDSGDPYRARNHEFVIQWYRNHGFDVIIGDSRHLMFNRSAAKNACVNAMTDDVCIIADSDILFEDVNELLQSVDIAREENKLVMPIFELYWLNEKNSDEILAGQTIDKSIIKPELYLSGGIHIVPRNVHAIIGGYDEGYAGWGYEDMDYYIRHNKIVGEYLRTRGTAYHLWHPVSTLDPNNAKKFKRHSKHVSAGQVTEWR